MIDVIIKSIKEKSYITITRPLIPNKEYENFIWKNSNYYRKIWNMFVSEFRNIDIYNSKYKDITKHVNAFLKNEIHHIQENDGKFYKENDYCKGISRFVAKNFAASIKMMRTKYKRTRIKGKFHFKKIDPFKCSFMVQNKMNEDQSKRENLSPKLAIVDKRKVILKPYRTGKPLEFELSEDLYEDADVYDNGRNTYYDFKHRYIFEAKDIRSVGFMFKLNRLYILLQVDAKFMAYDNHCRDALGIDTGIENPAIFYNEDDGIFSYDIPANIQRRLRFLDKITGKLTTVLNNKEKGSNNYKKVHYKLRKRYNKISNIKKDIRKKKSNIVSKRYKCICIDKFDYQNGDYKKLKGKYRHNTNHKAMYYEIAHFVEDIKNNSHKYNNIIIDTSDINKFNSTNMCPICGHVNTYKLSLNEREFECEECDHKINRDINSAMNCYNYAYELFNEFTKVNSGII